MVYGAVVEVVTGAAVVNSADGLPAKVQMGAGPAGPLNYLCCWFAEW